MALSTYKNPSTIATMGNIAENTTLRTVPSGNGFNPLGYTSRIVPFNRPGMQSIPIEVIQALERMQSSPQSIPIGPSKIVPFRRPGTAPTPPPQPIQFPQQPLRAPNLPPKPAQGKGVGQVVSQAARQTPAGRLAAKIAQAKAGLSAVGKAARTVGPTVGGVVTSLANPLGVISLIAAVPAAIQAGEALADVVAPEQAAAEAALAESIIRLEQAKSNAKQRELIARDIENLLNDSPGLQQPIGDPLFSPFKPNDSPGLQQPIGDPLFSPFKPTELWSPFVESPPIASPLIELPGIDPSQDIGIDFGPILRPGPTDSPIITIDPIQDPNLITGKGGVNLNTPIWQKISALEGKLDNLKIPEPDWSSVLAPIMDKVDLILTALPSIIEGLASSIELTIPPAQEIPQPDLTPIIAAVTTAIVVAGPPTIAAIGALLAPVITGITAVSAQIAMQKIAVAVGLPKAVNLAVALPQAYQMATLIPQALQQAIVIPQAVNLAVALPQSLSIELNDAANATRLDLINRLNIDQITALNNASEEAINQSNRIKNLTLQAKQCCNLLEKKLRDIEDEQKNIKNKVNAEADKNEQRFPIISREGTTKCKEDEDANNYSFGGYTLTGLQGHLDYMLELQKMLVQKLCNFDIGGDIEGTVELDCGDVLGEIIPYSGRGVEGLASQLNALMLTQKRIWGKICSEPEIAGTVDVTCTGDEEPTLIPYSGIGLSGITAQLRATEELQKRIWEKICLLDPTFEGRHDMVCPDNQQLPEFIDWTGRGLLGIHQQLLAMMLMQRKLLKESCERNEPIIIKAHYETHLEEFRVTKTLELTFGEEYPTQKGSLWQIAIPYPKGEFLEEQNHLSAYSLWNWDDDFEIERRHGSAYCRLDLAGSSRFMAVYAETGDIGKDWLRTLYSKFVDSNIAPPSRLDDDGLAFVRVTPGKKPRHNPIVRTTRCVRAVLTEFDDNNVVAKCAAWYPPRNN
jgi:hypothetical protein